MKPAFTRPTITPAAIATAMAAESDQPDRALSTAMIIEAIVRLLAIERSKSPAVSGMMSARLSTTSTACEPSIEDRFAQLRKDPGSNTPNTRASKMVAATRA
jgi:hypothetical protein